jgi:hypothetical protein
MEAKPRELQNHVTKINAILQEVCDASNVGPLVEELDGAITVAASCPKPVSREVTTELGRIELALRLPIPSGDQPRYWVALHERWSWKGKHKISFRDCGLRLYIAEEGEEAVQLLRLEWVAPSLDLDGVLIYPARHAGHPHWQIDRSALTGPEDYLRSLEALTAPALAPQLGSEEFSEATIPDAPQRLPLVHDCSFLQDMHFPAQAQWMNLEWDGRKIPAPHQCEPTNLEELNRWWAGALRYFSAELPR